MSIIDKITYIFVKSKNERSIHSTRNALLSFLIKLLSLPISFLLISLTINYVNTESYGVWLTISSIVTWMSFLDIGISNSLRNKLTESLAKNNIELSKKYVSTTYATLMLISLFVFLVFLSVNNFIDWSYILNTNSKLKSELSNVAVVVVSYFCLRFIFSNINVVLLSCHFAASSSLVNLFEQFSSLIVVYLLINLTAGSILNLALGLCVLPLIVLLIVNIYFFRTRLKSLSPSWKYVDFSLSSNLIGIGFKFFIIQIAGIIQFQSANFIIIQYFGANEVTIYHIAFKYFSILTMIMSILLIPFWSSVTDAYVKNDFDWIKNSALKFRGIAFLISMLGLTMLIFSGYVYDFWLGENRATIPFNVSLFMFIFSATTVFGGIYVTILNGISSLEIQFKASLISPFIFFIATYVFIEFFHFGVASVILATILANFNSYILAPLQYYYIFYKKKL